MRRRVWTALPLAALLCVPSTSFGADTRAPKIVHAPVAEAPAGKVLTLTAQITDDSEIFEPTLYYRAAGTKRFLSASLSRGTGATFTASIPGVAMTGVVEYFIEAYDAHGNGPARFASDKAPQKVRTVAGEPAKVAGDPVAPPPPPPPERIEPKPEPKPEPEIKVVAREPKPAEQPVGGLQKESGGTGRKVMAITGYTLAGVGVVGVGVGAFLGLQSKSQRDEAVAEPSASAAAAKLEEARGSATGANVAFIAGGVLAAAGVVLAVIPLVTSPSQAEPERSMESGLKVGPGSIAYTLRF